MDGKELRAQFERPGSAYRGKPFWSWNGELEKGELHVFDTSTFTTRADDKMNSFKVDTLKVDGDGHITSYMADVDTDANYTGDTEAIKEGYFAESSARSAPYFDLQIDGITLLNTKM